MHELYPYVKYSHLFFVVCTIVLFNWRFWLRTARPDKPLPVVLRILPHCNDSMLLFTGMLMMQIIPWKLFGAYNWLGTKLLLVIGYIVVGAICLRAAPRSKKWWICYAICMLLIGCILYLARKKPF